MSADAFFDAYEKGKNLATGRPGRSAAQADLRVRWRNEWNREESIRQKGYVCANCSYFSLEEGHALSKIFPDLGVCEKFGVHKFGTASCKMGRWNGARRPDAGAT